MYTITITPTPTAEYKYRGELKQNEQVVLINENNDIAIMLELLTEMFKTLIKSN